MRSVEAVIQERRRARTAGAAGAAGAAWSPVWSPVWPGLPTPAADVLAGARSTRPAAVTIGTFDGVHEGHRDLIAATAELAAASQRRAVVVTFFPRPEQILSPARALPDICSLEERIARLEAAGADAVVVLPFSVELAAVPAGRFARALVDSLTMEMLCVGEDFTLGRGRDGTPSVLRELGLAVTTVALTPSLNAAGKVSSRNARELISAGVDPDRALQFA